MTVRKNQTVDEGFCGKFVNAVQKLVDEEKYGALVRLHMDAMQQGMDGHGVKIHNGPAFLPWHRLFILKFEGLLQDVDSGLYLPYWDWTTAPAIPSWLSNFLPVVPIPGTRTTIPVVRFTGLEPGYKSPPTADQLKAVMNLPSYSAFRLGLEGLHDCVHKWIGGLNPDRHPRNGEYEGTMRNLKISPADPLFWLHHAFIDKQWDAWQTAGQHDNRGYPYGVTLDPWSATADDVLNAGVLGYRYGV